MKRVGIVFHPQRPEAVLLGRWLTETLTGRGVEVEAEGTDAAALGAEPSAGRFPERLDLLFALGGDGTLLRAAALAYAPEVPLLGINLGRLGFLAELERGELAGALDRILDDGFEVEERSVIEGEVSGADVSIWALNEVVIERASPGRAVKLAFEVDGEPFIAFAADGLVMATPTGSTAYSFSARGPVVSPRLDCLIVTAVSPHGLFDRSLVLSPHEEARVRVLADAGTASLALDGRSVAALRPGALVHARAGSKRLRLAKVSPAPFWRLVRQKLVHPATRLQANETES